MERKSKISRILPAFAMVFAIPLLSAISSLTSQAQTVCGVQASSLHLPEHHCTKQDDGSDYTDWSYVYFGSYPQSEVTDAATIAAIESAIPSSGASVDVGVDVWVEGTKYRRISKSDTNYDGYFGSNTYRYFKWEPIKWKVLSNNGSTLFVVANQGLDCKNYHETFTGVTWETCSLRSWLGNQFYNTAFSAAEQSAIVTQTVVNNDNPYNNTEGGNNTSDKVYLLSIEEVTNPAYGFCVDNGTRSAGRRFQTSDYSNARGVYRSTNAGYEGNCFWWLRSPGGDSDVAADVFSDGSVYGYGYNVIDYDNAVVPALHLNLSSVIYYDVTVSNDGNGTASASIGSGVVGTNVTLTTAPKAGYQFKEWKVVSGGVTVTDNKFTIGTADVQVTAIFEEIPKTPDEVKDTKTKATYLITSTKTNNLTVTYVSPVSKTTSALTVPDTVTIKGKKYKVTEIRANAFKNNRKLKKTTIGKNIKKIGKNAFSGCKNLKTVTIKTTKLTQKTVGTNAFKNIHAKAKIKVPKSKLKSYKTILKARGIKGKNQKITK